MQKQIKNVLFSISKIKICLVVHSEEPNKVLWSIVQNQKMCFGPQCKTILSALAHSAESKYVLWPIVQNQVSAVAHNVESTHVLWPKVHNKI